MAADAGAACAAAAALPGAAPDLEGAGEVVGRVASRAAMWSTREAYLGQEVGVQMWGNSGCIFVLLFYWLMWRPSSDIAAPSSADAQLHAGVSDPPSSHTKFTQHALGL